MKIKLLTVPVTLQNNETRQYTTGEMVEHIVRNGREFGRSHDAAKVAQGARLMAACKGGSGVSTELEQEDVNALKAAVAKPSCGWISQKCVVDMTVGIDKKTGQPVTTAIEQRASVSALDLLPLIEGVLSA